MGKCKDKSSTTIAIRAFFKKAVIHLENDALYTRVLVLHVSLRISEQIKSNSIHPSLNHLFLSKIYIEQGDLTLPSPSLYGIRRHRRSPNGKKGYLVQKRPDERPKPSPTSCSHYYHHPTIPDHLNPLLGNSPSNHSLKPPRLSNLQNPTPPYLNTLHLPTSLPLPL